MLNSIKFIEWVSENHWYLFNLEINNNVKTYYWADGEGNMLTSKQLYKLYKKTKTYAK